MSNLSLGSTYSNARGSLLAPNGKGSKGGSGGSSGGGVASIGDVEITLPNIAVDVDWSLTQNQGATLAIKNKPDLSNLNGDFYQQTNNPFTVVPGLPPKDGTQAKYLKVTGTVDCKTVDTEQVYVPTAAGLLDFNGNPLLSTVGTTGQYTDLLGKPSYAPVASTGSYADLIGAPPQLGDIELELQTVPTCVDWNLTSNQGSALAIKDKPFVAARISQLTNDVNMITATKVGNYVMGMNRIFSNGNFTTQDYVEGQDGAGGTVSQLVDLAAGVASPGQWLAYQGWHYSPTAKTVPAGTWNVGVYSPTTKIVGWNYTDASLGFVAGNVTMGAAGAAPFPGPAGAGSSVFTTLVRSVSFVDGFGSPLSQDWYTNVAYDIPAGYSEFRVAILQSGLTSAAKFQPSAGWINPTLGVYKEMATVDLGNVRVAGKLLAPAVSTVFSYADLTNKPVLATVATTGSYNDLVNQPSIPARPVFYTGTIFGAAYGQTYLLTFPAPFAAVPTVLVTVKDQSRGNATQDGYRWRVLALNQSTTKVNIQVDAIVPTPPIDSSVRCDFSYWIVESNPVPAQNVSVTSTV